MSNYATELKRVTSDAKMVSSVMDKSDYKDIANDFARCVFNTSRYVLDSDLDDSREQMSTSNWSHFTFAESANAGTVWIVTFTAQGKLKGRYIIGRIVN